MTAATTNPPHSRGGGSRAAADGGGGPHTLRRVEVYDARRARQELSLPEVLLWQRLKGAPDGVRFRKQHPIGPYRADFYCAATKLVIEIDGVAHDAGDRPERDAARTAWLENKGYRIVRIAAAEVLRDAGEVSQSILALAASPLRQSLRDCHLPINGEDLILPVHGEGDQPQAGGGGGLSMDRLRS